MDNVDISKRVYNRFFSKSFQFDSIIESIKNEIMILEPLIYLEPKDVSRFVLASETPTRIIVPGPGEADKVRDHFSREFFEKNVDPETMSSFVKKCLGLINKELKVVRKSVLLKELSSVWAKGKI